MRRVLCFVLLGFGVFVVALGLLLRFYAYPNLAKVPLDIDSVSVAKGSDVTAVLVSTVDGVPVPEIKHDLNITSVTRVTGDLDSPEVTEGGDVAVWTQATKTTDDASGTLISASVRSLCFDRHTGQAVAPCTSQYIEEVKGERVTADPHTVQQPGLSFKFPFGTEQRDYRIYDQAQHGAVAMRFAGEEQFAGLDVYRFVAETPPTKLEELEVPGSMIGQPERPSVLVERYYEGRRTYWVEPETGVVVQSEDSGRQEFLEPGQFPGEGTVVYEGTMRLDEKSVAANVADAQRGKPLLALLTFWPVVMWLGGGLLAATGVLLLIRRDAARAERLALVEQYG